MSRLIGDAPFTDGERALLISEARKLIGMPWKHQGRKVTGADCIGFPYLVMCKIRYLPKPRIDYGKTPSNGKLESELELYLGPRVTDGPRPADIVTLAWGDGQHRHLAIVTPHPDRGIGLLHADNSASGPAGPRVVEHGVDAHWRNRIRGVWRP